MTGLEKIIEQIRLEAQAASEEKLAQANKEAEQILADAELERKASYDMTVEQVDAEVAQLLARGQSAASLQKRKLLLDAKQQIMRQIFEDATETMCNLPQKEYFELLTRMLQRYALQEAGDIHLSKRDMDRSPKAFLEELEARQLTIAKDPVQLKGGFLLSYGEILQNCSFEALLAENRELLQDELVQILF